jgi:peptide/nickel transport system permease protein
MKNLLSFFKGNTPATVGTIIVLVFVLLSVFAPWVTPYDANKRVARGHQPPSAEYILGTTRSGKDVLSQVIYAGRVSLLVGFGAGLIATIIAVLVGITSAYAGGIVDSFLMFVTNVFLVIPGLPMIIVLAAFIGQVGPLSIALILGLFGWAGGARVLRAQALSIREKEFVTAAEVIGESKWRIVLVEMLPNMVSLIVGTFAGATLGAVMGQAALEFIGLGDPTVISWGTMLQWAQHSSALIVGAWWEAIVPGITIAIFAGGLTLFNMGMDQVSNPQLKGSKNLKRWKKLNDELEAQRRAKQAANKGKSQDGVMPV